MSDPVTNVEIEDVLSSIRRLVSEDARPRHVAANPMADRLVLTPSQRVPDPEVPNASRDETPGAGGTGPQDPIVLTDYAADPAPDVGPPATEDSSDADESLTRHDETTSEAAQSPAPEAEAEDRSDEDVEMEAPETFAHEKDGKDAAEDAASPAQDDTLARMVEQEVASALSEMSGNQDPLEELQEPADDSETAEEAAHEDPSEPRAKPPSLEQKVAQLEAMIAGTEGDWETDEPAPEDTVAFLQDAADAMPWQDYHVGEDNEAKDDAEAFETSQKPAPANADDKDHSVTARTEDLIGEKPPETEPSEAAESKADAGTPDDADAFSVDDAPLIDEDMLRDMVAEIVRQELQGALGERITRNVRKLVRREIHRALLSQHLE